jgi:predicted ATP-dependent serine protease
MIYKCNICGTEHELNLGSLRAHARWDKATKKDRKELGKKLAEARKNKGKSKLSTP